MAHYLLAASPLPGHVLPMLHIAADLRRRGHEVELLTSVHYDAAINASGAQAIALPDAAIPHPPDLKLPRWMPRLLRGWLTGRADLRAVFIAPLEQQYQALRTAMDRKPVDAILVDVAFVGVLPLLLSDEERPPVLVFGVAPLALSSVDTPPFGVGWQPIPNVNYNAMTRVVHRVMFAAIRRELDLTLNAAGRRRSPVFITDWPVLADRVLQLTVPEFEYPRRDLPDTVLFTGPVLPDPPPTQPFPDWWGDLDAAAAVVLVTQGTWDNNDLDQLIGPTIEALADQDCLVVATTGRPTSHGPRRTAANARVVDYVPYGQLLPRVDVMITNGGYGGVHYALAHGVPLIVAGDTADKPEIAARIAYIGAGIDMGTGRPTPRAIAAAVRRVLDTPDYRVAAQRMQRRIATFDALDTIHGVLREVCHNGGMGLSAQDSLE